VRAGARALIALAVLLGGAVVWARLFAGGNVGPIPGGWLRGQLASERPGDWSFANREPYLQVESDARTLPYSASVWFVAYRGRLHLLLPAFFGDALKRRLDDDPRLRVALSGKLYDLVAVPITDASDLAALLTPVIRRQFAIEIAGPVTPVPGARGAGLWVYRLDDPPR